MWTIFRKSLKTGNLTRDLTEAVEATGFHGPPRIQYAGCTACGSCVQSCPAAALTIAKAEGYPVLRLDLARCVFCGRCASVCPEKVISISNRFHWASKARSELSVCGRCGKG